MLTFFLGNGQTLAKVQTCFTTHSLAMIWVAKYKISCSHLPELLSLAHCAWLSVCRWGCVPRQWSPHCPLAWSSERLDWMHATMTGTAAQRATQARSKGAWKEEGTVQEEKFLLQSLAFVPKEYKLSSYSLNVTKKKLEPWFLPSMPHFRGCPWK